MAECEFCGLVIANDLLNWHLGSVHKYDQNFRISCQVEGCQKSYRKWTSYRQHMWRVHPNLPNLQEAGLDNMDIDVEENVDVEVNAEEQPEQLFIPPIPEEDDERELLSPKEKLRFRCALFVGRMREKCLVPQSTLEAIIEGTTLLLEDYLEIIKDTLLEGGENMENVPAATIREVFQDINPSALFTSCKTNHLMETFMTNSLGLVEPTKTLLGNRQVWTNDGTLQQIPSYAYVVPFLKSLEQCLNNKDILRCVENPKPHTEGVLKTVTDGTYYRNHRVYQINKKALSIMIYYDDVEYTNPLGSKTHKVGMFYWVLNNIYPEYRSTFKVHNLLAVVMTKDLKEFGCEIVLENFISGKNALGQEDGVVLNIRGVDKVFHGLLNTVAGDAPASGYVGGFKEGVGGALHPCRRCLVTKAEVKLIFDVFSLQLRTLQEHLGQLEVLDTEGLTPQARKFWTKQFGVNSKSPLLKIEHFDVTQCLPHDIMHTVLEGVLPCHILFFMKHCIAEGLFDLESFNAAMVAFDLKCLKKNKPSRIEPSHLQNGLRQSAAQMLCLGQMLPFIIGRWLNEEVEDHLNVFILLMQIINICLAFEIHDEDADMLNLMIRVHHTRFQSLYGSDGITPKWHYMLHLSEQILMFGPPRQHWCMRCEALHSYFKNVSTRNKNFKNLCFTFATRKQKLQCLELANVPGLVSHKFFDQDKVGAGQRVHFQDYAHREVVNACLPDMLPNNEILVTNRLEVLGSCFNNESIILLNVAEEGLPSFGRVVQIVVWQNLKVIVYSLLETEEYEPRLNSY